MTQGQTDPAPGRKVLVVDDSVDSAKMLALMLRLGGHDARTAYDGESALATAISFVPEVAFLDLNLPGMSGYELARRLRPEPTLDRLILVAMTGFGDDEDRQRTREAGFDHHLVKPADPQVVEKLFRDER
jgi:CheY-like chemotaxis protein